LDRRDSNLLGNDTHRIVLNTASVDATLDTDITVLTPALSPRVLDDPVLGAILNTPAYDGHTVIRLASIATIAVHDAAAVVVELGGVDGDSKRTVLLEGSHDLVLVVGSEGVDALDEHLGLAGNEPASVIIALIAVVRLEHHATVVLDEVHGISGPAAAATVVVSVAIDDLLLRKGKKLVVLEIVGTLHSSNTAESPAGTALHLILNLSHSTLGTPVELVRKIGVSLVDLGAADVSRDVKKSRPPLLIRENGPAIGGSIDLVQLRGASHVLLEDGIVASLLTGGVDLTELLLVSNPEGIVLIRELGLSREAVQVFWTLLM